MPYSTNRFDQSSERVPFSRDHIYNSLLRMRAIHELKTKDNRMKIEQYGERSKFGFPGTCPSRNFV